MASICIDAGHFLVLDFSYPIDSLSISSALAVQVRR